MIARAAIVAAVVLVGCGGPPAEQCLHHSSEAYGQALVKVLAKNGISGSLRKDGGICYPKKDAPKAAAVAQELSAVFFSVGVSPIDECEEKRMIEWATQEGLSFEITDLKDSGGKRRGKIIHILSLSREEAAANKRKVQTESPRGKSCAMR